MAIGINIAIATVPELFDLSLLLLAEGEPVASWNTLVCDVVKEEVEDGVVEEVEEVEEDDVVEEVEEDDVVEEVEEVEDDDVEEEVEEEVE